MSQTPEIWTTVPIDNADGRLHLPPQFQRIYMPGNNAAFVTGTDQEARARLIAAAPDLLDALTDYLTTDWDISAPSTRVRLKNKAREAITKATGEQP